MNEKHPALGKKAKDKITGFKGVVTGYSEHLLTDSMFLLEDDSNEKWISVDRIELEQE